MFMIETARIVPCTNANMVASVKAAAPATAAMRRKIFAVTLLPFCGRSASFAKDGPDRLPVV
jgi:hypothetical protein